MMERVEPRFFLSGVNGAASQLIFVRQPGGSNAGRRIGPIVVDVIDSSGNLAAGDRSVVTLSTSGAELYGSTTAKVKNGQAIFRHLSIRAAGTYSLEAQDGVLTSSASGSFTISASKGTKLIFSEVPAGTIPADNTFPVQLQLTDRFGNTTENEKPAKAKVALRSHPKLAVLFGLTKESTAGGSANFENLRLDTPGTYTLRASIGKSKAISNEFVVNYQNSNGNETTNTNSFILPYTARVFLTPIGGTGAAASEFGLGTSKANINPLFENLPHAYNNYSPNNVGTYLAGTPLDLYLKTSWGDSVDYAFSDDTVNASSRTAFMDLDNSLGLGGNVYQKMNDTTYIMHLDDAASYNVDDNDNDVLIRITLIPVSR